MTNDSLGDRMKSFYESIYNIAMPRRTNVIIRIDGKAFHTYTRGLKKPYDTGLNDDMDATTKYLCQNIQGCKCGYVQSDEISLLLTDYDRIETDAWFSNKIQKMASIAASMATSQFNKLRTIRMLKESDINNAINLIENMRQAEFDARVFVIPSKEEIVNYFIWRQQDATRNSISTLAQSYFSPKELHGKKTNDMQDMLMLEKNINWNNESVRFKRGGFIRKITSVIDYKVLSFDVMANNEVSSRGTGTTRTEWQAVEIPIITQDRDFILNLMP
jgi:tRNA(His) 5'-end guanylyltransferase